MLLKILGNLLITSTLLAANSVQDIQSRAIKNRVKAKEEASKMTAKFVKLNPDTGFGPEVITNFDFTNVSLVELTKHMQGLTGINLIWEENQLKGKISISAPGAITVGDAWKAYLTALNNNGYTVIKSGNFYKITKAQNSRSAPTNIYSGQFNPDTDNFIMKIIPLKNIDASDVQRKFRPFTSRYGRIITVSKTNTIIIHDTGSNINKVMKLINLLDVPGHQETLYIIKVKHSSAQEMATILDKLLNVKKGRTTRASKNGGGKSISRLMAEPRSNSIIALANRAGAENLKQLIEKLDVKVHAQESGKIHVYYLNYGNAENLAKTLNQIVSSQPKRKSRFASRKTTKDDEGLFSAPVKVTADKDNNAIVVTASPTDWLTMKSVIEKLDIPRDQVYVEGLIMETNITKQKDFGISVMGVYGGGIAQKTGFSGPQSNVLDLVNSNITNLSGLFLGGAAGTSREIKIGGTSIDVSSVNMLLKALATDSNTNVLATPQIMAMDNEEAEFEVGESIPVSKLVNNSNGTQLASPEQQKVTLRIKITPQINKVTRFIKLKIDQNIEDFSQRNLQGNSQGAATTIRRAVTTVVAKDGDTIAMGGLMRDQDVQSESKVPLLGDIPVLGWLFKQTTNQVTKVNLLFFLTPKIMSPYEESVSSHLKDLLNRRGLHLKDFFGEDDPFATTVNALWEKSVEMLEQRNAKVKANEANDSSGNQANN